MAGLLADSSFGTTERSDSELIGRDRIAKGASFVVLDVARFLPVDQFRAHVDRLIDDVHASELAPGHDRVMVPGELEAERREERLARGIPLPHRADRGARRDGGGAGVPADRPLTRPGDTRQHE